MTCLNIGSAKKAQFNPPDKGDKKEKKTKNKGKKVLNEENKTDPKVQPRLLQGLEL